jgi:hypothetical protein
MNMATQRAAKGTTVVSNCRRLRDILGRACGLAIRAHSRKRLLDRSAAAGDLSAAGPDRPCGVLVGMICKNSGSAIVRNSNSYRESLYYTKDKGIHTEDFKVTLFLPSSRGLLVAISHQATR